jgi:hypothetical protein
MTYSLPYSINSIDKTDTSWHVCHIWSEGYFYIRYSDNARIACGWLTKRNIKWLEITKEQQDLFLKEYQQEQEKHYYTGAPYVVGDFSKFAMPVIRYKRWWNPFTWFKKNPFPNKTVNEIVSVQPMNKHVF